MNTPERLETKELTCAGCYYADPNSIACLRPDDALDCWADGSSTQYIYVLNDKNGADFSS